MDSSVGSPRLLAFLADSLIIALLLLLLWRFVFNDFELTIWCGLYAISFVYFLLCDILFEGQTIGKKLHAIKVSSTNFQTISLQRWFLRNLLKVLLAPISSVVWLFCADRSRALHDNVVNTQLISL